MCGLTLLALHVELPGWSRGKSLVCWPVLLVIVWDELCRGLSSNLWQAEIFEFLPLNSDINKKGQKHCLTVLYRKTYNFYFHHRIYSNILNHMYHSLYKGKGTLPTQKAKLSHLRAYNKERFKMVRDITNLAIFVRDRILRLYFIYDTNH